MDNKKNLTESEHLAEFLKFIRDASSQYEMARLDEEEANLETQDILHALELCAHPYHKKARIAVKLGEVRRRRRVAKNATYIYGPIADWADQNKAALKSLERLLGDVRKTENIQKNRCYVNRTSIMEDTDG